MKKQLAYFLLYALVLGCSEPHDPIKNSTESIDTIDHEVNYDVHTFYYNWYGNVEVDGRQFHWNHDVLPHWSDHTWDDVEGFPGKDDIGANFYPELGCYSSNDKELIDAHMKMIRKAGIGVVVITWWGKDSYEDKSIIHYLNSAKKHDLKIAIHIEPFYLSAEEFKAQVDYLAASYSAHEAIFKVDGKPFYYVYDSYKLEVEEWNKVLLDKGDFSVRNTTSDAIFIGLWVKENDGDFFKNTGLDGFYTYFASDGFEFGCTTSNWKSMSDFAKANDLLFIPCAGPGYIDTRIRPWNAQNIKERESGMYYETMFKAAVESNPDYIGITSFNEWHEGTQIEPAVAKTVGDYTYENYGEHLNSWYYIHKTRELIDYLGEEN